MRTHRLPDRVAVERFVAWRPGPDLCRDLATLPPATQHFIETWRRERQALERRWLRDGRWS